MALHNNNKFYSFVTALLLLGVFHTHISSAVKLTITPKKFDENVHADVTLDCRLDKAEEAAKEVMLMKIARKGEKAMVILHPGNSITYDERETKEKLKADGRIENDVMKSFLKVRLLKLTSDDVGTYSCIIDYTDETSKMVEDKNSGYLNIQDRRLTDMKGDLTRILKQIKQQSLKIRDLEVKVAPVAFAATSLSKHVYLKTGQDIVLPDVIMQVGQAYNGNNGVFTAPKDGLYAFHFTAEVTCPTCKIRVKLVSNQRVLIKLRAGDEHTASQSTVSTLVELKTGAKVKAIVIFASEGSFLTNNQFTVFSGYYVSPINYGIL